MFSTVLYISGYICLQKSSHPRAGAISAISGVFLELGDYPHEAVHIIEVLIHRRESDICYNVNIFKSVEHHLADLPGGHLALEGVLELSGYLVHHILYCLELHRTLYSGPAQPVHKLLAVERLDGIILLYDHKRDILDYFVCCKTESALDTLTAAAHLVFSRAGVYYLAFLAAAFRTLHVDISLTFQTNWSRYSISQTRRFFNTFN